MAIFRTRDEISQLSFFYLLWRVFIGTLFCFSVVFLLFTMASVLGWMLSDGQYNYKIILISFALILPMLEFYYFNVAPFLFLISIFLVVCFRMNFNSSIYTGCFIGFFTTFLMSASVYDSLDVSKIGIAISSSMFSAFIGIGIGWMMWKLCYVPVWKRALGETSVTCSDKYGLLGRGERA